MSLPDPQHYLPGSSLEIPGLEATLEYGDASTVKQDRIPGAMLINDHSRVDRARITQLDGLHDDPESSENRQANADRHGETAGRMLYRGRTVGLTGRAEAGNVGAMRNTWRRLRSQFGVIERDLLVHHPFEVRALRNEVLNPDLQRDAYGWASAINTAGAGSISGPSSVVEGISNVGEVVLTGATGGGTIIQYANLYPIAPGGSTTDPATVIDWDGRDVWITARVKLQSASVTPTSMTLGLAQWSASGVDHSLVAQTVTSPVTGTWYLMTFRVPALSLKDSTLQITPVIKLNFTSAGSNYTIRFTQVAIVFVDAEDPDPPAYFCGNMSGFSWLGPAWRSQSIGPTYAQNKVVDPRFEQFASDMTLSKWGYYSTGLTINQAPIRSSRWSGDYVDGSVYFKATKDNTATSRAMGLIAPASAYEANNSPAVAVGRRYRWSAKVNLLQRPATGTVTVAISWLNQAGTQLSAVGSDPLTIGESLATIEATAPAGAVKALAVISNPATTTALAILEMFVSDACFTDVTDWDPGNFYGVGDVAEEVGSCRRIPRPFLLKRVRKSPGDMKAPEQQSRSRAWRDFTMSLRAADPRIYCLDERRMQSKLPTVASMKFVVATGSSFITTPVGRGDSVAPAPVPTGFTYEGQSIPSTVAWTTSLTSPGTV